MAHYNSAEVQKILGINRDDFVSLAQLLGSDYAHGVFGIGPVLAMEIIAEFRGILSSLLGSVLKKVFLLFWRR
jgi:5'-3' exonuclease